jgi:hypothetical protein
LRIIDGVKSSCGAAPPPAVGTIEKAGSESDLAATSHASMLVMGDSQLRAHRPRQQRAELRVRVCVAERARAHALCAHAPCAHALGRGPTCRTSSAHHMYHSRGHRASGSSAAVARMRAAVRAAAAERVAVAVAAASAAVATAMAAAGWPPRRPSTRAAR